MLMNLYILVLVSFPEALLNLYIIMRLAGKSFRPQFADKKLLLQFFSALTLMLAASLVIRPLVPDMTVSMIAHIFAYTAIITLIFRMNILRTMFSVFMVMLFYSAVENLYLPFIIVYVSKGLDNFYLHYQLFVIYSLPYRLAQVAVILLIRKYEVMIEISKISKSFNKVFILVMFCFTCLEYSFAILFYAYFNVMSLAHQILFSFSLSLLVIASSALITHLVYVFAKEILIGGYKQYKDLEHDAECAFKKVYGFIEGNNLVGAKQYIDAILEKS